MRNDSQAALQPTEPSNIGQLRSTQASPFDLKALGPWCPPYSFQLTEAFQTRKLRWRKPKYVPNALQWTPPFLALNKEYPKDTREHEISNG